MEKFKIAICDDFEKFREMMIEVIRGSELYKDAEIQEYEDGEDIVNDYEAGKFDVIFMDYYMERMKGDEATKLIYAIDKRVSIVIASTQDFIRLNGNTYLTHIYKPFGKDVFENVMKKHQEKIDNYKGQYREVCSEGKKKIIIAKHITYIDRKNGTLYTDDGDITCPDPLPDFGLEKTYKLQNGNIINLEYISRIQWRTAQMISFVGNVPLSIKDWLWLKVNLKKYH